MKTPRKTWQTPQVFVLGAEGTQAYQEKGVAETIYHIPPQVIHLTAPASVSVTLPASANAAIGYES